MRGLTTDETPRDRGERLARRIALHDSRRARPRERGSSEIGRRRAFAVLIKTDACSQWTQQTLLPNRILIVEDHPDTQQGLQQLLQLFGYHVLTANNGQQGLMKASAHLPDLIITDVMMPVMDGIEMVKQLRASTAFRNTPIIVVSAYITKAAEAVQVGANDVLPKPIDPDLLMHRIEALL
jgi:CheY-like chemotaxis protein